MRAIVLSAGQGRRLRPHTAEIPKCLLAIDGDRSALELQLRALARCGVEHATVAVGFAADRVDQFVKSTPIPGLHVETLYNPFYATSDNLATCWICRVAMTSDFVLLNGDTLFEDRVLRQLIDGPRAPVTVTIDHKSTYDDDDMKVSLDPGGRLRAIGKKLLRSTVGGESIGLLAFRDSGVAAFRDALDRTIRQPTSLGAWYLSVVNEMAQRMTVQTASIQGLWWREIDSPEDLADARISFPRRQVDATARDEVASA
ncbi:MAG: phosphocholine cytidylyltransferase family protein [Myxococcales bacterium]|nr:phosphocholine cytidylyltransferase family protein [Myxococcales bacterium]